MTKLRKLSPPASSVWLPRTPSACRHLTVGHTHKNALCPKCQGLTSEAPSTNQACPPLLETTKHRVLWDTGETRAATQTMATAESWGAEGRTITSRAKTQASTITRQPKNQSPGHVRDAPNTYRGSQDRRQGPSAPHPSTCEHLENAVLAPAQEEDST